MAVGTEASLLADDGADALASQEPDGTEAAPGAGTADSADQAVLAIQSLASVPHILDLICRTTGVRFASVARVTEDRWVTCASLDGLGFGLGPGDELPIDRTMCKQVCETGRVIAFDDAEADEDWRDHPIPRQFGIRGYVSMPIVRRDGSFFGTLCGIDTEPRRMKNPETLAMFRSFADLIAVQLDESEALLSSRQALRAERAGGRLREQFIAVLGHDLRNPLASLASGLRILERDGLNERGARTVSLMQATVGRMNALIDNLLDLARGRLGKGLASEIGPCHDLRDEITQVIGEIRAATGQTVELDWNVDGPVRCDRRRLGQLASNLVSNAVTHGDNSAPVRVRARTADGTFVMSVENTGEPIPPEMIGSLFRPYFRGGGDEAQQGLGLGLFIAHEIARAHGGTLKADSTSERTRFTLTMPA